MFFYFHLIMKIWLLVYAVMKGVKPHLFKIGSLKIWEGVLEIPGKSMEFGQLCPAGTMWSILGQNRHIYCHNLQMTRPKLLKLGTPALQYINKKPTKNQEYLMIWFCKHLKIEIGKWKLIELFAQGHMLF